MLHNYGENYGVERRWRQLEGARLSHVGKAALWQLTFLAESDSNFPWENPNWNSKVCQQRKRMNPPCGMCLYDSNDDDDNNNS